MAIKVRIPTALRRYSNGAAEIDVDASSIDGVIAALESECPGIRERLIDDAGAIRRFINLYVNGEDVRFAGGLGMALKSGDEVSIVPAMAGG